jgi:hypothetical protein
VIWQYRTILFEFQKDGLLGDKYVDDEEVEKVLNEQGEQGWELVGVTAVQEGLLTFFKRGQPPVKNPQATRQGALPVQHTAVVQHPVPAASPLPGSPGQPGASPTQSPQQRGTVPAKKTSTIADIKIS